jgi:phosphonoacetaldehyde hydrolase
MMSFNYLRTYRGPVRAVVFDWGGTTVDFGCMAPALVFVEIFKRQGVKISMAQAREPMGMHKRDHIAAITRMPAVADAWQQVHGQLPDDSAIDAMYADFVPLQIECIERYSDLVPGLLEIIARLRDRNIKIGSNTGYSQEMMDVLVPAAAKAGYAPDSVACSTDVPLGRPAPWMVLENARQLGVYPLSAVIKVDDTIPGIEAGLNAGMWTVGVTETGNEVGLSLPEFEALDPQQQQQLRDTAARRLAQAGAHYVIDSVRDLEPCVDDIERRMAAGETP